MTTEDVMTLGIVVLLVGLFYWASKNKESEFVTRLTNINKVLVEKKVYWVLGIILYLWLNWVEWREHPEKFTPHIEKGLVVGGVLLLIVTGIFTVYVVIVTLMGLGTLVYFVVNHLHHLKVQQNLRIYHSTREFMMNTGVREEENKKLYKFYQTNFFLEGAMDCQAKTRTSWKNGEEVEEVVTVWFLKTNHSESESESMNEMEVPSNLSLIGYGFIGLSSISLVVVLLGSLLRFTTSG
jgi:hypothetical protein